MGPTVCSSPHHCFSSFVKGQHSPVKIQSRKAVRDGEGWHWAPILGGLAITVKMS